MSIEVRPLNVACNIKCHYCYQNPQREGERSRRPYDLDKIKAAVEQEGGFFTIFGGEPLLVPEDDLEDLWSWGWNKFRRNAIQTNGVLINENHIRLFKKYNVGVGISLDGPDDLNDVRWAGSLEATRRATAKSMLAVRRLCEESIAPSLIVTLHRGNATDEKLPRLAEWFHELDRIGVRSVRLHILEVDNPLVRLKYALSDAENIRAFMYMANLEFRLRRLRFDTFKDIRNLLIGMDERATCVWTGCDPYTTQAVRGIEGQGQRSNCGRTNKDGVDYVKSATRGYERYLSLSMTPQEYGGCSGCRYFIMCKGQCPGTSIKGDWRNRSEHCNVWKALFSHFEIKLIQAGAPVLADDERRMVEQELVDHWSNGSNSSIEAVLGGIRQKSSRNQSPAAEIAGS